MFKVDTTASKHSPRAADVAARRRRHGFKKRKTLCFAFTNCFDSMMRRLTSRTQSRPDRRSVGHPPTPVFRKSQPSLLPGRLGHRVFFVVPGRETVFLQKKRYMYWGTIKDGRAPPAFGQVPKKARIKHSLTWISKRDLWNTGQGRSNG